MTNPFSIRRLPLNIRLHRAVSKSRLLQWIPGLRRHLSLLAARLPLLPHCGSFEYRGTEGQPAQIHFDGHNSQFHAIYDECYALGYELETAFLLELLLDGHGTFADVGANWGCFGLLAASLPSWKGRTRCYEPNPRVFRDLESVIRQAGLEDRVTALPKALGAMPGKGGLKAASAFESGTTRVIQGEKGTQIEISTLDQEDIPDLLLVKIDVEGMELDVLKGGHRTIQEQRPFIIFESTMDDAFPSRSLSPLLWLQEQNYELFIPAVCVEEDGVRHAIPYGTAPSANAVLVGDQPLLFPVQPLSRSLHPAQLNLLAVPREKRHAFEALIRDPKAPSTLKS